MATSASGRDAQECGGGAGGVEAAELAGDDRHLGRPPIVVAVVHGRHVVGPQHREVRARPSCRRRQVEPDLEQLERVRLVRVEQREHLGVDDARARR